MSRTKIYIAFFTILLGIYIAFGTYFFQLFGGESFYDYLTDAFMHGQLSLLVQPSKQLLALDNPYDAVANAKLRLHDASLYNGKYYLYWGAVPAVLRVLTFNVFTRNETFWLILDLFGCALVSFFILKLLIKDFFKLKLSVFTTLLLFFPLGFHGIIFNLLGSRGIYYESIIAAQLFFLLGVYFSLRFFKFTEKRDYFFMNLFIVLSIGTRFSYLIPGVLMIAICLYILVKKKVVKIIDIKELFRLSSPFIIGMASIAFYNYFRFGSFGESGIGYQLAGFNIQDYKLFNLHYFPNNFRNYFLAIPNFFVALPPVAMDMTYYSNIERIVFSVFLISPVTLFAVPYFIFENKNSHNWIKFYFLSLTALIFILLATIFAASATRYFFDFIYILSFLAIFNLLELYKRFPKLQILFKTFLVASALWVLFISSVFYLVAMHEWMPFYQVSFYPKLFKVSVKAFKITHNQSLLELSLQNVPVTENNTPYLINNTAISNQKDKFMLMNSFNLTKKYYISDETTDFDFYSFEKTPQKVKMTFELESLNKKTYTFVYNGKKLIVNAKKGISKISFETTMQPAENKIQIISINNEKNGPYYFVKSIHLELP